MTRDGDTWVINGSKIWTSGANIATHGLMLARTDWTVPKHRGLSMLIVPLGNHSGVTIEPILQVNREPDFCQEFFDDVTVPADHLLGAENDGWAVAQRLLFHERNTTAGIGIGHGYMGPRSGGVGSDMTHGEQLQRLLAAAARRCRPRSRHPAARRPRVFDMLANEFARAPSWPGNWPASSTDPGVRCSSSARGWTRPWSPPRHWRSWGRAA